MNSSEAFQFVTIEQSESRLEDLGAKCVRFLVFFCLCIPSLFCPPSSSFPVKICQQKPKLQAHLLMLLESSVEVRLRPLSPLDGVAGEDLIDSGISTCSWNGVLFVILFVSPEEAFACVFSWQWPWEVANPVSQVKSISALSNVVVGALRNNQISFELE